MELTLRNLPKHFILHKFSPEQLENYGAELQSLTGNIQPNFSSIPRRDHVVQASYTGLRLTFLHVSTGAGGFRCQERWRVL
jgi:hypothetical protein